MRHYHGLTLDKILRLSDAQRAEGVGCWRVEETPLGARKRYGCEPGPATPKPPTTRSSPRCVCGRVAKHCVRKMGFRCQCGEAGGVCAGAR